MTVCIENIRFQFLKNFNHRCVRDAHLLRYKGLAVAYYGCILELQQRANIKLTESLTVEDSLQLAAGSFNALQMNASHKSNIRADGY